MADYDNTNVQEMTEYAAELIREINSETDSDDRKDEAQ